MTSSVLVERITNMTVLGFALLWYFYLIDIYIAVAITITMTIMIRGEWLTRKHTEVIDGLGNAVSMVNSNYEGFGSGIVPKGCGFTLQNRGGNFSLEPGHPNAAAPRKRPYHTIIPALALHHDTKELFCSFTNMGGFAQAPAHVQLMVNMLDYGFDPQTAIDMPRFVICDGEANGEVAFEDGFDPKVIEQLERMGHKVFKPRGGYTISGFHRMLFGRAQIITRDRKTGVLCGGSDGRADGLAIGY